MIKVASHIVLYLALACVTTTGMAETHILTPSCDDDSNINNDILDSYIYVNRIRQMLFDGASVTSDLKNLHKKYDKQFIRYIESGVLFTRQVSVNAFYKVSRVHYDLSKTDIDKPGAVNKVVFYSFCAPDYYLNLYAQSKNGLKVALAPLKCAALVLSCEGKVDSEKATELLARSVKEASEYMSNHREYTIGNVVSVLSYVKSIHDAGKDKYFVSLLSTYAQKGKRCIIVNLDDIESVYLVMNYSKMRYDDGNTTVLYYSVDKEIEKKFINIMKAKHNSDAVRIDSVLKTKDDLTMLLVFKGLVIEYLQGSKANVKLLALRLQRDVNAE